MKKQAVVIIVGLMLAITAQIPLVMMSMAKETPRLNSTQTEDVLKIDVKASSGGVAISFSNNGTGPITNLTWKMDLKKAFIFYSKDLNGSIEKILPGKTVTVNTGIILGIALPFLVPGRNNGNITANYKYSPIWGELEIPSLTKFQKIIIVVALVCVAATALY